MPLREVVFSQVGNCCYWVLLVMADKVTCMSANADSHLLVVWKENHLNSVQSTIFKACSPDAAPIGL
jgi:hypothetical protein